MCPESALHTVLYESPPFIVGKYVPHVASPIPEDKTGSGMKSDIGRLITPTDGGGVRPTHTWAHICNCIPKNDNMHTGTLSCPYSYSFPYSHSRGQEPMRYKPKGWGSWGPWYCYTLHDEDTPSLTTLERMLRYIVLCSLSTHPLELSLALVLVLIPVLVLALLLVVVVVVVIVVVNIVVIVVLVAAGVVVVVAVVVVVIWYWSY